MEEEPYSPGTVRRLCRAIIQYGVVSFSDHAYERMEERDVAEVDVKNVIRGGVPDGVTHEHGTWRYAIRTPKISVRVAFRYDDHLVVVTVWRNNS